MHKTELHKKYVGKSHNLCQDMVHLFHQLFEKPQSELITVDESEFTNVSYYIYLYAVTE